MPESVTILNSKLFDRTHKVMQSVRNPIHDLIPLLILAARALSGDRSSLIAAVRSPVNRFQIRSGRTGFTIQVEEPACGECGAPAKALERFGH
jgi:hypothetical protein